MSAAEPHNDPLPRFAREVIELFAEALRDVRFPDLDAGVLEEAAEQLRAAHAETQSIEAELERAWARSRAQEEQLLARAQRALAYARVFAADDAALLRRIGAVGQAGGREVAPSSAKKRGRPRKSDDADTLFAGADERNAEVAESAA